MTAQDDIAQLERLVVQRGIPQFIRSDNGPGFVAKAVQKWIADRGFDPGGICESLCFSAAASGFGYEEQQRLNLDETLIRVGSKNGGTPGRLGVGGSP